MAKRRRGMPEFKATIVLEALSAEGCIGPFVGQVSNQKRPHSAGVS